ncbi:MAG TPA: hypothetical protein P5279_06280 [Anaerohalosphaeraceae bacterium]|nr:hypothetical protein [Anaerohalosphaeraceae bacterium]HRT85882.1 hypothetical protein [Anaerohalosphaeraceae bacterium]
MTDKERDDKINKIYDVVIRLQPMVEDHHTTLYGNGKPGLKEDVAIQKLNYKNCPARLAASNDNKRTNIAYIMMVIAIISLIVTVITTFT